MCLFINKYNNKYCAEVSNKQGYNLHDNHQFMFLCRSQNATAIKSSKCRFILGH